MVTKFVVASVPDGCSRGEGSRKSPTLSHPDPPRRCCGSIHIITQTPSTPGGEGEIRCQTCRYRVDTLAALVPAAFLETRLQQPAERVWSDGEPSRYIVPKLHRTGSVLYPPGGSSMLGSNQHCACPDSLLTVAKSDPILPPSCEDRRLGRTAGPVS